MPGSGADRFACRLVEPSGAVPLAGLRQLRDRLAGRKVAIAISGANIDQAVLRRILCGEI